MKTRPVIAFLPVAGSVESFILTLRKDQVKLNKKAPLTAISTLLLTQKNHWVKNLLPACKFRISTGSGGFLCTK